MENKKSIFDSVIIKLEYNKIAEMLAQKADTAMGKELAQNLRTAADFAEVNSRLNETAEAVLVLDASYEISFGGVRDIREVVKRAALGASLEPRQFLFVLDTLGAARRLRKIFADLPSDFNAPFLKTLAKNIVVLKEVETAIDSAISDSATVKDSASAQLAKIRRDIKHTQHRLKEKLDNIIRSAEYQKFFQDSIVTIRNDRYVIPVKQEYRNNFPGIVHDQSASGATLFIEPMAVLNMNNDLNQMMAAEKNEVEKILADLSVKVAQTADAILENCEILARLDFVFAKAKLALAMRAVKPIISQEGHINLVAARHPLIAKEKVVPINVRLGMDFNILLITGPNTGGKTVALKTTGLFALMVKAGLFIPASPDSVMPVIKNIFADIGDEQSIEQSLSTFSAHMTNIAAILSKVSPGDLVLVDEIGAGTDPDEGAALAMAIIEYLLSKGVKVIATTHYSELKTFAFSNNGIENASVEFDLKTLSPTYRLQIGIPGGSNAFAISRRLGLDEDIIERARGFISKNHADFAEILAGLETQKRAYQDRLSEIESIRNNLQAQKENWENSQTLLTEKRNNAIINAKEEAAAILRQTRRETEELIKVLKEQFAEKDSRIRQQHIEEARRKIKEGFANLADFADERLEEESGQAPEAGADKILPGAIVYVAALGQKGEVLSVSQDSVTVQVGIMKTNVLAKECRLLEKSRAEKTPSTPAHGRQKFYGSHAPADAAKISSIVPRQIDIRGMTIEEASIELDRYIDGAILSGLNEILIIHGKGTGALRKGVQEYLDSHIKVKEKKIAELSEGGLGATKVKLL